MRSFGGVVVAVVLGAVLGVAAVFAAGAALNPDRAAAQSETVATVNYGAALTGRRSRRPPGRRAGGGGQHRGERRARSRPACSGRPRGPPPCRGRRAAAGSPSSRSTARDQAVQVVDQQARRARRAPSRAARPPSGRPPWAPPCPPASVTTIPQPSLTEGHRCTHAPASSSCLVRSSTWPWKRTRSATPSSAACAAQARRPPALAHHVQPQVRPAAARSRATTSIACSTRLCGTSRPSTTSRGVRVAAGG